MADKTGYIGRNPGDSSVTIARQTYTPTSNTTEFTFVSGYTVGLCDVYLNGVKLVDARDYDANTGSTVGLTSAATSGDIVEIIAYKAFNLGQINSSSGNFDVNSSLSVGSTSTLSGVVTTGGDLYVGGNLYTLGDVTYDEVNGRSIYISGIATVGTATTIDGSGINVTGVITATSFSGDGSALTGIAATDNINTNNIKVSGITTLGSIRGDINIEGSTVGVTTVQWDASANSLEFKDSASLSFGTNNDLLISHTRDLASQNDSEGVSVVDGWTSYINENGTGGLVLKSNGNSGEGAFQFFDTGWRPLARMFSGSSAKTVLYHAGLERFATTPAGINVTGISSATQSIHVAETIYADGGTGIITATQYKGDGSALTGVGGEFDITSCLFI